MINSITAKLSSGSDANVFDAKEVNVAINSTMIYNTSEDTNTNITIAFMVPEETQFLNIQLKPKETIFIDTSIHVNVDNYLKISTDSTDVNFVFSFIEDARVNTIV